MNAQTAKAKAKLTSAAMPILAEAWSLMSSWKTANTATAQARLRIKMMSSYQLPEGNTLISFSGGRTSGYMLHKILEENGNLPNTVKVVFANTGREMPETLSFVQDVQDHWNVPIVWLEYRKEKPKFEVVSHNSASRNGEPFEEMLKSKTKNRFLPNQQMRFCTSEMKVLTIKRYLVSLGWTIWSNCVGIRADESHRIKQSKEKRWSNWYPLSDAQETLRDVAAFWKRSVFDLKVMKGAGNCDGCFLKSEATLAAMWREHPDRMQWWTEMEAKVGSTFHKNRSYQQLGDFVQRQGNFIFNDEAFLCQQDHGECTG